MAKTEQLLRMGASHGVPCITIKSLIQHVIRHQVLPHVRVQQAEPVQFAGADQQHAASSVPLQRLRCPDGSEAVFAAFGDVQCGTPTVRLIGVRPAFAQSPCCE